LQSTAILVTCDPVHTAQLAYCYCL